MMKGFWKICGVLLLIILICAAGCVVPDTDKKSAGLVVDIRNAEDSFNAQAVAGLNRSAEEGVAVALVYVANNDSDAAAAFADLESKRPAVILSTGNSLTEYFAESARKNPDLHYATFDGTFNADSGMPGNMMNVLFRSEEPSYLAGYLAGMMTKTQTIGFIGGMEIPAVDRFYYGYRAGAELAAEERGQNISVEKAVVGNFYDRETAKLLADKMYDGGADVVLQAAGDAGLGVIEAAKEREKYVIGVDMDQRDRAPENVLTSVTKNLEEAVYQTITAYVNGEEYDGEEIWLGLADNAVGLAPLHPAVPDAVAEKIAELSQMIKEEKIDPPATAEEYAGK
ncbi:MAG: BMP family ABC transporter substrate-binding protein [Methanocorpusculum sp.]|nr:BMP family ABC transporter substrate-binding protein [Methanocorpusculum sp.]